MRALLLGALLLPAGCLKAQLRGPVEDHYVQTQAIVAACIDSGMVGEGKCTADLLEAMVKQAEALDNIVQGKAPEEAD